MQCFILCDAFWCYYLYFIGILFSFNRLGLIHNMEVLNIRQSNSPLIPRIMEKDNNLVTSRQSDENAMGVPTIGNGKQPFNIDFKWQSNSPTRTSMNEPFPFIAYLFRDCWTTLLIIMSDDRPQHLSLNTMEILPKRLMGVSFIFTFMCMHLHRLTFHFIDYILPIIAHVFIPFTCANNTITFDHSIPMASPPPPTTNNPLHSSIAMEITRPTLTIHASVTIATSVTTAITMPPASATMTVTRQAGRTRAPRSQHRCLSSSARLLLVSIVL